MKVPLTYECTLFWNISRRGDHKGTESSFRSMLQENMNASFQSTNPGDHSSTVTCQGFHHQIADSSPSSLYGSPSTFFQGILTGSSENSQQQQQNVNYPGYNPSYNAQSSSELLPHNWSNKVPQLLRISPPKHHPPPPHHHSQLHFSNNAPFWTASATAMNDVRSTTTTTYFPPSQAQFAPPGFDEKPKVIKKSLIESIQKEVERERHHCLGVSNCYPWSWLGFRVSIAGSSDFLVIVCVVQNLTDVANPGAAMKKSGGEPAGKRPRNETTPSPLPAFKVQSFESVDLTNLLEDKKETSSAFPLFFSLCL